MIEQPLLTEQQAAELLNIHRQTLQRWRLTGESPKYSMIGSKPRYNLADLTQWVEEHSSSSGA